MAKRGRPRKSSIEKKLKKTRTVKKRGTEPMVQCTVCTKYEEEGLKLMLFCLDCTDRVRPECLEINYEDFNTLKSKYRCEECSSCVKCERKEKSVLFTCKYCIRSYHVKCQYPEMLKECVSSFTNTLQESSVALKEERNDDENVDSPKSTSARMKLKKRQMNRAGTLSKSLPSSPEIQSWNIRQVHDFFEPFFPDESNFISENEIDGQALLLLTREDIIRKDSPWKLGGLLKFYNVITKIQNNKKKL